MRVEILELDFAHVAKILEFIEGQKKTLKVFGPMTWCTKKPFGYRVADHGYL